jgi:hypothetical protein
MLSRRSSGREKQKKDEILFILASASFFPSSSLAHFSLSAMSSRHAQQLGKIFHSAPLPPLVSPSSL